MADDGATTGSTEPTAGTEGAGAASPPGPGAPGPGEDRKAPRIGIGLLVSVGAGFGPLRDAATGNGSFTQAMARYLVCLAVSVGAVLVLGRLLDGAPPAPDPEAEAL